MKVLVINCGSSSLKYQLFDMTEETRLARGIIERIGERDARFTHRSRDDEIDRVLGIADHPSAFDVLRAALLAPELGLLSSVDEIDAIGHRVVHGAEVLVDSTIIDELAIETIEECGPLAPLHNPANLAGIKAAQRAFPNAVNVAVFDTAFHRDMPPHAYHYAIPYELYERLHVRRYGFHGTSHRFVASRAAELLGIPYDAFNAITLHLGNGCSATAVMGGKSIDTSLGMTPLEGLVMGTRSGDIDPGVIFHLANEGGLSIDDIDELLNKKSGLLGLSGVSNDMREVQEAAGAGNRRAHLAIEVFVYRIRKYIGAYIAIIGRTDAIVFTGGIGENGLDIRRKIATGLEHMGIVFDAELNAQVGNGEGVFSTGDSHIKLIVVPTNEELYIARETRDVAISSRRAD